MQRKQFIGLSVLSLFGLLAKKVFGDTIEQPKIMATQIKNILLCPAGNATYYFDLSPWFADWWAEVEGSLPTGIAVSQDAVSGSAVGFIVTYGSLDTGTHTVTIKGYEDNAGGAELGLFTLTFTKGVCATEQEVCCGDDGMVIRWLGREGGIKQWPFPGVRDFDMRVGDAITFKNQNNQAQYAERKNIYTGKRLTTGDITQEQSDFLDELKYAIQVWEWDGETATPILLNNESFNKYGSRQKFFDVSISYIVSEAIQIQTQ